VSRSGVLLLSASSALVAFAWLADGVLDAQMKRASEAAAAAAAETARLSAASIRAALAQIEPQALAGRPPDTVRVERLPIPPPAAVPGLRAVPYSTRPRPELARLLRSRASSPSGLPEAVLARLALGDSAGVSIPGEPTPPDVAEQLLSGALPVRPDDLPFLARALGLGTDRRVIELAERLRRAPEPAALPPSPAFRRARHEDVVDGWTAAADERVHYQVALTALLAMAHAGANAVIGDSLRQSLPDTASAGVPDVEGLMVQVPVTRSREIARLRAVRAALWLAALAAIGGLAVVRRAIAAEARAAAREKRFLANVTHELRTPLAAIRLFGERLATGRGDAREYGTLISEESQRLEALVERVLSMTRAGERPQLAVVQPEALLRSAGTLIQPRAERRQVTVTYRVAPDLPDATWDAEAVRHAILELLDNAVKHGRERGTIAAAVDAGGGIVSFAVADDGPGISRRTPRQALFARFVRGETEAAGTGLGLPFVEQVADAHGGRVDLVSEEGRGCVFTLRLPVAPPGPPPAEPPA
jgi:signal transduction histidine kinase